MKKSSFTKVLEYYQYRSACEDPNICGESFSDGYAAEKSKYENVLFTYLGYISRTGSGDELSNTLARLHRYIPFTHDSKTSVIEEKPDDEAPADPVRTITRQPTTPHLSAQVDSLISQYQEKQTNENAKYTSLLYEHGNMICSVPEYEEQQIRMSPQWFSVVVRFRGIEGYGEGPNKKTAKHLASKDACDKLGISHRINRLSS
jgi:hypothetical protein